ARVSSRLCTLLLLAGRACSCSCQLSLCFCSCVLASLALITMRSTLLASKSSRGCGPRLSPSQAEPNSRVVLTSTWAARMPPNHCCDFFILSVLLECVSSFQEPLPMAQPAALPLPVGK